MHPARIRFRAGADECCSVAAGGYRGVAVCLSLDTAETRRLGLDAAVCELQLVIVGFARLKVPFQLCQLPSSLRQFVPHSLNSHLTLISPCPLPHPIPPTDPPPSPFFPPNIPMPK